MNQVWYRILWVFAVVAILTTLFALFVPVQDYALGGFKEYVEGPTPATLRAFQGKQREATQLRLVIAGSCTTATILLAVPLLRLRSKLKESD
jgi:hypothetical protein